MRRVVTKAMLPVLSKAMSFPDVPIFPATGRSAEAGLCPTFRTPRRIFQEEDRDQGEGDHEGIEEQLEGLPDAGAVGQFPHQRAGTDKEEPE